MRVGDHVIDAESAGAETVIDNDSVDEIKPLTETDAVRDSVCSTVTLSDRLLDAEKLGIGDSVNGGTLHDSD